MRRLYKLISKISFAGTDRKLSGFPQEEREVFGDLSDRMITEPCQGPTPDSYLSSRQLISIFVRALWKLYTGELPNYRSPFSVLVLVHTVIVVQCAKYWVPLRFSKPQLAFRLTQWWTLWSLRPGFDSWCRRVRWYVRLGTSVSAHGKTAETSRSVPVIGLP